MFFAYAALLVGLAVVVRRRVTSFEATLGLFALGGMFMLTIPARPLYDHLRPLEALQYPYRMYTLVEIAVTGLVASALSRAKRPLALAGAVAGVLGLVTGVAAVRTGHFDCDEGLWQRRVRYASDYGLFRPSSSTRRLPTDDRRLFMKGYHGPDVPPLPRATVTRGEAHVEVTRWRPRDIGLSVEGGPATIVVGQLYYPGWEAALASGSPLEVTPTVGEGLVQVQTPGGSVEVSLRLVARRAERLGLLATSLGLLALGGATLALLRAWAHREGSG